MGRKIGQQPDLFVREGADLLAVNRDRADQLVIPEHWHVDNGTRAAKLSRGTLEPSRNGDILDIHDLFAANHFLDHGARKRREPLALGQKPFGKGRGQIVRSGNAKLALFVSEQHAEFGLADAHCVCQHGPEHRLQFARR